MLLIKIKKLILQKIKESQLYTVIILFSILAQSIIHYTNIIYKL